MYYRTSLRVSGESTSTRLASILRVYNEPHAPKRRTSQPPHRQDSSVGYMYIVLYARKTGCRDSSLQRARVAEALLQLAALEEALDVGVAADVLLGDEDVGDGALARHDLEGVLGLAAVD